MDQLSALQTSAGVAIVTTILCEVIIRALGWAGDMKDRFGPLLAVVVGVVLALVAVLALGAASGADVAQAVLIGIIGGASAMGIHDVASGTVAGSINRGGG